MVTAPFFEDLPRGHLQIEWVSFKANAGLRSRGWEALHPPVVEPLIVFCLRQIQMTASGSLAARGQCIRPSNESVSRWRRHYSAHFEAAVNKPVMNATGTALLRRVPHIPSLPFQHHLHC
ncbi:hypothetical protein F1559_001969 [Cyanidiococcus yangmingshanensis]|uniref:Uncharacterized protein n=1 Tax=Cyanidiococcus yangmingshanensis TaxID=2690220 RepID=A0A7J7IH73_9RHOD|nr:hypothetical protein F1559_001969 [Cyanidiococcus yangmingshanensis]